MLGNLDRQEKSKSFNKREKKRPFVDGLLRKKFMVA